MSADNVSKNNMSANYNPIKRPLKNAHTGRP